MSDEETAEALFETLTNGPLQKVHEVDSLESFLSFFQSEEHKNSWPELVVAMCHCALGRYAKAREILEARVAFMEKRGFIEDPGTAGMSYFNTAPRMLEALRNDISQVPKLLHEFEQAKIRYEKLEAWHESTAFPCELAEPIDKLKRRAKANAKRLR